ncbi:TRAP transporter small permease [Limnohabitans sp. DCL3]|uniref:TRAP transporter small permease n=1 Tax=Limnohabitans sp. DCL3 TaxID=3374103 RepID=UPI003A83CC47
MKKSLEIVCGGLAGVALLAIMLLTFLDVSGRKFLSQSITGSLELTELLMVVVIFGALPLVSLKGEHVVFDSLDAVLPAWLQRIQRALVDLVCAALLLGLAYLMWNTGGEFAVTGETTAQLKITKAPFIQGMGVLCGLTALVHLVKAFWPAEEDASEGGTL